MKNKLISVIVTAYNVGDYLERCLESLLKQSYEHIEVIVVDDGSTDGTAGICERYAESCSKIRVVRQPENRGVAEARNAGLAAAKGDYIGFVDGDDWAEPDMYRAMLGACEETNAEIAICSYRQIGAEQGQEDFSGERYVLTREEALEVYICDHRPWHIYHSVWSKLFRKGIVAGLKFPRGRESEDIMYTTRALLRARTCVFLDTPYYNYLTNRQSSIMNHKLYGRRFHDEIPFWKEQAACLLEEGFEELSKKASYHFYRTMLFYYVDFRDRKMKAAGRELIGLLRGEKKEIKRLYEEEFVTAGDKARMRLALMWPSGYYWIVKGYDRFVVPLKQHRESFTRKGVS
ncbi:MAG: glycosyltransferase [Clostridium sp.]|nr:glycosyltransferase [Clostridium sp.]